MLADHALNTTMLPTTTTALTYLISEADYIAAQRVHMRNPRGWTKVIWPLVAILGLFFLIVGIHQKSWALSILGIFYGSVKWWTTKLINEPLARLNYRKYPAIHAEQTLRLKEDGSGVLLSSSLGETNLVWPLVTRWLEDENYLLMYLQPRLFFVVPKRADPQGGVLLALRGLLGEHVKG